MKSKMIATSVSVLNSNTTEYINERVMGISATIEIDLESNEDCSEFIKDGYVDNDLLLNYMAKKYLGK